MNFDAVYYVRDIDTKVELLTGMFYYAFDMHAPIRTARVTKNAAPWLILALSRILKERRTFAQNPTDIN
nr:unnamed protein product [Callosobruchus analis]